jgi:SAM-dependent methyltransferase
VARLAALAGTVSAFDGRMTIRRHAARAVAALPPPVRWRVRNLVALARWMPFAVTGGRHAADVYPDAFWDVHQGGDWAGLAAVVLRSCAPRSLVDVGCGAGSFLAAVRAADESVDVLGIDSSPAALARARRRGVPVEQSDPSLWRTRESKRLGARIAGFDVAVSLETAEHLPPWSGPGLVRILTQGRLVVFSAAQPGQGGTLHMNERPFEYWLRQFAARGFRPSGVDAAFREAVGALDLPWWYAANIHVFERGSR